MARLAENGPVLGAVVGIGLAVVTSVSAVAQFTRPTAPNERQVYLVREDAPDCQNSHIRNADSDLVSGNVRVTRMRDENTSVKVAITAVPRATYHFFLKCVRELGEITTDDEGVANVSFAFPTNLVGNMYAFDLYAKGAPAGNKFESAQVKFQ